MEGYWLIKKQEEIISGNLFQPSFQDLLCRTLDAYRPNKDVKLRPKGAWSSLEQINSINYQNLFGCDINKKVKLLFENLIRSNILPHLKRKVNP